MRLTKNVKKVFNLDELYIGDIKGRLTGVANSVDVTLHVPLANVVCLGHYSPLDTATACCLPH